MVLYLLVSFINDRVQCVKIRNLISQAIQVTSKIGQVTYLGPPFSLTFINYVSHSIKLCDFWLSGDGMKLIEL